MPRDGATRAACRHFASGSCRKGSSCPYAHEVPTNGGAGDPVSSAAICRGFIEGSCTRGASCRFAHALPASPERVDAARRVLTDVLPAWLLNVRGMPRTRGATSGFPLHSPTMTPTQYWRCCSRIGSARTADTSFGPPPSRKWRSQIVTSAS
mmetsp:Transcript_46137/g.142160  ORF Transcript_46137/g.142160 Transcript_46137/m.142160 type:complete len:152 (-) Transcript_46137:277-732(-)